VAVWQAKRVVVKMGNTEVISVIKPPVLLSTKPSIKPKQRGKVVGDLQTKGRQEQAVSEMNGAKISLF
jgi:hypothetical protein